MEPSQRDTSVKEVPLNEGGIPISVAGIKQEVMEFDQDNQIGASNGNEDSKQGIIPEKIKTEIEIRSDPESPVVTYIESVLEIGETKIQRVTASTSQEINRAMNVSVKVENPYNIDTETIPEEIGQDTESIEEINKTNCITNIKDTNFIKTIKDDTTCSEKDHRQQACNDLELIQRQVVLWRVMLQRLPASLLPTTVSTVLPQAYFLYDQGALPLCDSVVKVDGPRQSSYKLVGTNNDDRNQKRRSKTLPRMAEKLRKCKFCDFRCDKLCNMKGHMRKHKGEKPFKCEVCDYRSAWKSCLKAHMITHTKEKRFKCEVCNNRFAENGNLKRHIIIVHSGEKPYKCKVCSYSCPLATWLPRHMKIHTKGHTKRHTREKLHKCDLCEYCSVYKSDLKKHYMIHTGETPHKCKLCYFQTRNTSHLKVHVMRVHTGEKPYKCDLCDYRTVTKNEVDGHKATHSPEKPFKCEVCDCRYKSKNYLRTHTKTHFEEKLYKCEVCDYGFKQIGNLKRHNKRKHTP